MCAFNAGAMHYTVQPYDNLWMIASRYNTTVDAIAMINPGIDLNYLYSGQVINLCPGCQYYTSGQNQVLSRISRSEADLSNYLRMLWNQHVVWTRLTITSIVFSLPDLQYITNRLLRNPKDFEAALITFYGAENASKFANLLNDHLVIAAQLVKAAKAGNNRVAAEAEKKWYANADEIAAFLASINPYWTSQDWKTMLYDHLTMTKKEAVDMLTRNYQAGIDQFDQIEKEALQMADVMSQGIVRQFPGKFTY